MKKLHIVGNVISSTGIGVKCPDTKLEIKPSGCDFGIGLPENVDDNIYKKFQESGDTGQNVFIIYSNGNVGIGV